MNQDSLQHGRYQIPMSFITENSRFCSHATPDGSVGTQSCVNAVDACQIHAYERCSNSLRLRMSFAHDAALRPHCSLLCASVDILQQFPRGSCSSVSFEADALPINTTSFAATPRQTALGLVGDPAVASDATPCSPLIQRFIFSRRHSMRIQMDGRLVMARGGSVGNGAVDTTITAGKRGPIARPAAGHSGLCEQPRFSKSACRGHPVQVRSSSSFSTPPLCV